MRRSVSSLLVSFVVVFASFRIPPAQAQQEEMLGRQAEQAGRPREALTHYVAALQFTSEGSASDQSLREKIISLVQKLTPPPAVPDEARNFAVRGQIAFKEAKSQSDYVEATKEFSRALKVAPWWTETYFNLAVAQEKAGQVNDAVRSLKLYLLAAPNAPDADKIKDQIYALEYREERARKDAQDKADEARRQEQARLDRERREAEERRRAEEQSKAMAQKLNGQWRVDRGRDLQPG